MSDDEIINEIIDVLKAWDQLLYDANPTAHSIKTHYLTLTRVERIAFLRRLANGTCEETALQEKISALIVARRLSG